MSNFEIAKCCAQAMLSPVHSDQTNTPAIIHGISKLSGALRIQFTSENQADKASATDWNKAFKATGVKLYQPSYGIVLHGIPTDVISPAVLATSTGIAQSLEKQNNIPNGTITKITALRRQQQPKPNSNNSEPRHHSIVIYLSSPEVANEKIKNGICIDYTYYKVERFTPQFQIKQCFKCQRFGHLAAQCKQQPRCGKCGDSGHCTQECKIDGKVQCALCEGNHEAWHTKCPARTKEKRRLERELGHSNALFE
jgi:Zinc knuckle